MSRIIRKNSPWLSVPAEDYERHMLAVGQQQALNKIFKNVYKTYGPRRLAILGIGTGNGHEHINLDEIEEIVGFDINEKYLSLIRDRYSRLENKLKLIAGDLSNAPDQINLDWVHAALLFEYVSPVILIPRIAKWLRFNGICSIVLQQQTEEVPVVTNSGISSLIPLSSIMRLQDPSQIKVLFEQSGFSILHSEVCQLTQGKHFWIAYFGRDRF